MKNYIHYVHNIPEDGEGWISNSKRKSSDRIRKIRRKFQDVNELQRAILQESSPAVFKFVSEHLGLKEYFRHIIFSTDTKSYIDNVDFSNVRAIINFRRINDIQYINEHFRSVNKLLPQAGIYIGKFESYFERKLRFYKKAGSRLGKIWWLTDFVVNRVISKMRFTEGLYNLLTNRNNHVVSKAEILGRLVYSGFTIIEFVAIEGNSYFVAMKTGEPSKDKEPSFHPLITLNRVGRNGKMMRVFKFRTMHPYSEYLQDYVLKLNGYNDTGKPANDFRVARWGKIFRKLWIDEIPQFINVLRGEMQLMGVRPLSKVRFGQLPEDVQKDRIKYKPGCFPPYVALNMPDSNGNIEAEIIYLNDLKKHPHTTNIRYFFMAVYNILTNKIRSS